MKVSTWEIPEEGLSVKVEKKEDWMRKYHTDWPEMYSFTSPLKGEILLKRNGTKIIITGFLTSTLKLQCSRCLESFNFNLNVEINSTFYPLEEYAFRVSEPVQLKGAEMDMEFYRKGVIEVDDVISEHIILNLPLYPLCKPDCRGICPTCGKNLNFENCTCEKQVKDVRWTQLIGLKEKLKGKE